MAAAKKKSRKELLKEPDAVLTWSTRLLALARAYQNAILIGVIGLLAAAALFSGYRYYAHRQEAQAGALLEQALAKHERLRSDAAAAAALQGVADDFERIIASYGGRSNADAARLVYANLLYEAGDFEKAAAHYRALRDRFGDFPLIRFQVIKSLAYTQAALGDEAGAARTFETALAGADPRLADGVLYELGRLYARLGESEKSRALFQRILSDHPNSTYAALVKEQVSF